MTFPPLQGGARGGFSSFIYAYKPSEFDELFGLRLKFDLKLVNSKIVYRTHPYVPSQEGILALHQNFTHEQFTCTLNPEP
jgi:hypothetical protein